MMTIIRDADGNIQLNKTKSTRGHPIKIKRSCQQAHTAKHATKMWNNLQEAVVTAKTTNTFKNRLDKYWENNPLRWGYAADHDYTV